MTGKRVSLGRTVTLGALFGAAVGAGALLLVTVFWLGFNVYYETQKPSPGVPDLVSPLFFAALYFLVYVVPATAAGAVLALIWWTVAQAVGATAARKGRRAGSGASA